VDIGKFIDPGDPKLKMEEKKTQKNYFLKRTRN
jgi:hypothetical protein